MIIVNNGNTIANKFKALFAAFLIFSSRI